MGRKAIPHDSKSDLALRIYKCDQRGLLKCNKIADGQKNEPSYSRFISHQTSIQHKLHAKLSNRCLVKRNTACTDYRAQGASEKEFCTMTTYIHIYVRTY